MSTAPTEPPPPRRVSHISHSARETLERCAKSYFLKYMTRAPRQPAVWLAGGSAVHEVTESYDLWTMAPVAPRGREKPFDLSALWDASFNGQLEEIRAKEPNENAWKRAGSEDIEVWRRMGPGLVQAYIDWRERSPWEVWTTPDGEPAIELDVSGRLPGCPVEVKAYLDRVFEDKAFGRLWIVDLKSGKTAPKNDSQFKTYAALLRAKYKDLPEIWGTPFLNRRHTVGKTYDLVDATPKAVGAVYGDAWAQIQRGHFPADGIKNHGCFICDVSAACAAVSGPLAHLYDPDSSDYPLPF
jgi:putative RecB family exonuclease